MAVLIIAIICSSAFLAYIKSENATQTLGTAPDKLAFVDLTTTTDISNTSTSGTTASSASTDKKPVTYFKNCTEALSLGYSNINSAQLEYRTELDRNKNGIACETDENKLTSTTTKATSTIKTTANTTSIVPTAPASTEIKTTTTTVQQTTTTQPPTTVKPTTTVKQTTTTQKQSPTTNNTPVELEIAKLVNEFRQNPSGRLARKGPPPSSCSNLSGLQPFIIDKNASKHLSRDWSQKMASTNAMSHRPLKEQQNILSSLGISFRTWGENVGWHSGYRNLAEGNVDNFVALKFFEGWRDSDSHFCNLVNRDFTHIAVGHVYDTGTNKDWATQNFYG